MDRVYEILQNYLSILQSFTEEEKAAVGFAILWCEFSVFIFSQIYYRLPKLLKRIADYTIYFINRMKHRKDDSNEK